MWKDYFLWSSRMYLYFRIIHIKKYWKQIFITFVTKVQGLNNHQYLRLRHQRLEALARKTYEIYSFFPEISFLTSSQCPCSLIMSCNICYSLKQVLQSCCLTCKIYNSLWYEQDNSKYARYPTAANVFIYFYLNDAYQLRLLKIGCGLWVIIKIARIRHYI